LKLTWANSSRDAVWKILNTKRIGEMVQVIELPPCKCEALSSSPSTIKKKRKKERKKKYLKHFGLGKRPQQGCRLKES
jgi:hypothetical protein